GSEKSLRRRARVPAAGLLRMAGREPEHVAHRFARLSGGGFRERGWGGGFLPRSAEVLGAEDRGAQMARAHRREQRAPVARVEHGVIDDVAEEMRALHRPFLAPAVGLEQEETLAGADED